jgi:hypothetical protein
MNSDDPRAAAIVISLPRPCGKDLSKQGNDKKKPPGVDRNPHPAVS